MANIYKTTMDKLVEVVNECGEKIIDCEAEVNMSGTKYTIQTEPILKFDGTNDYLICDTNTAIKRVDYELSKQPNIGTLTSVYYSPGVSNWEIVRNESPQQEENKMDKYIDTDDLLKIDIDNLEDEYAKLNATFLNTDKEIKEKVVELSTIKSKINAKKSDLKFINLMKDIGFEKIQFIKGKDLTGKKLEKFKNKNVQRKSEGKPLKPLPKDVTILERTNDKAVLVRSSDDKYDKEKAFLLAYFQLSSGFNKTETAFLMEKVKSGNFDKMETMKLNPKYK